MQRGSLSWLAPFRSRAPDCGARPRYAGRAPKCGPGPRFAARAPNAAGPLFAAGSVHSGNGALLSGSRGRCASRRCSAPRKNVVASIATSSVAIHLRQVTYHDVSSHHLLPKAALAAALWLALILGLQAATQQAAGNSGALQDSF